MMRLSADTPPDFRLCSRFLSPQEVLFFFFFLFPTWVLVLNHSLCGKCRLIHRGQCQAMCADCSVFTPLSLLAAAVKRMITRPQPFGNKSQGPTFQFKIMNWNYLLIEFLLPDLLLPFQASIFSMVVFREKSSTPLVLGRMVSVSRALKTAFRLQVMGSLSTIITDFQAGIDIQVPCKCQQGSMLPSFWASLLLVRCNFHIPR